MTTAKISAKQAADAIAKNPNNSFALLVHQVAQNHLRQEREAGETHVREALETLVRWRDYCEKYDRLRPDSPRSPDWKTYQAERKYWERRDLWAEARAALAGSSIGEQTKANGGTP